jgi:dimethylhistidine N-methyltransferase
MDARRLKVIDLDARATDGELADVVREGLTSPRKWLPCYLFYDAEGSRIFEEICELPEYYLTRAEHEILEAHADEIAGRFAEASTIVELGSGSARKTRLVIEAFLRRHGRLRYVPVDVSRSMLEESARGLLADYPRLEILAIAAEYRRGLQRLRGEPDTAKLLLWLGSSIGNFTSTEAERFLASVAAGMGPADRLVVGADLRKDRRVLLDAYDDRAGVTARFNKNILVRMNRELGANFDLSAFRHEARWNPEHGSVEMHLVSTRPQRVSIPALDLVVAFAEGEGIHTESSHKYTKAQIENLGRRAGLALHTSWTDRAGRFVVVLLGRDGSATHPAQPLR